MILRHQRSDRPAPVLPAPARLTPARSRRGSAYVLVLVTVTIVTATGLSALLVQRVRVRGATISADAMEARTAAASAIELGLQRIVDTPDWRSTLGDGPWLTDTPLGSWTISLSVVGADGLAMANGSTEPATLVASATVGGATQMAELTVEETPLPPVAMEVLSYPAVAGGNLKIKSGKQLTVSGGSLATNTNIQLDGSSRVIGDVHAMTRSGSGTISGTATIPTTVKPMPGAGPIGSYQATATLVGTKTLKEALLSDAANTLGAVNPDGIYLMSSEGANVTIQDIRLLGTLVVDAGGGTVSIKDSVLMESPSPDQPVLLVIGDLKIEIDSVMSDKRLDEYDVGLNFNPSGTPYLGSTDRYMNDSYPNTIRGLVHVTGTVTINNTSELTGVLIAESGLVVDKDSTLIHDPAIADSPPPGYTASPGTTTTIVAGSWKKRVN